jgi:hypothetical protein
VTLGAAESQTPPPPDAVLVKTRTGLVDITDMFRMQVELGNYTAQFHASPYDHRPLMAMRNLGQRALPMFHQLQRHPGLNEQFGGMAQHLASLLKTSQSAARLRIKAAHDMARRPLQLVPLNWSLAFGTTSDAIQVRNPYLGSSGGVAVSDQYRAPWSVTAFRTSNNENGQLNPIRITQWLIGGHDYVAAAVAGLTNLGAVGTVSTDNGWPAAAFTETARKHHSTAFEPWNLTSEQSAGFGFIMTETGFLQIRIRNAAGSGTYVDNWSVYIRATLCGSPFSSHTDVSHMARSFVPIAHQYSQAARIAGDWQQNVAGFVGQGSAAPPAASWASQINDAQGQIQSFLDAPPPGIGEPLPYDDRAFSGYPTFNG